MKVTTKTVDLYTESFDDDTLHAVKQFFEVFECCNDLEGEVGRIIKTRQEEARMYAENKGKKEKKHIDKLKTEYEQTELMANEDKFPGEPKPLPVIGFCPKCKSKMGGAWVANCETRKSGRFFVRECSACSYHAEIFKKRNKYYEVEGG